MATPTLLNFSNLDSKAIAKVAKALELPVNVLAQFCEGVRRSHEALDEGAFGFDSLLTPSGLTIQAQYSGGSDKVEVTIRPVACQHYTVDQGCPMHGETCA
jgi:hypothetical protein